MDDSLMHIHRHTHTQQTNDLIPHNLVKKNNNNGIVGEIYEELRQ